MGRADIVRLLSVKGANIEAMDRRGLSALHQATSHNHLEVVKILLRRGADPFALDRRKKIPLNYVLENGNMEIVERLKEKMSQRRFWQIESFQ